MTGATGNFRRIHAASESNPDAATAKSSAATDDPDSADGADDASDSGPATADATESANLPCGNTAPEQSGASRSANARNHTDPPAESVCRSTGAAAGFPAKRSELSTRHADDTAAECVGSATFILAATFHSAGSADTAC